MEMPIGRLIKTTHIKLFLVDDHEVVRHGFMVALQHYIEQNPALGFRLDVVGSAKTGEEALVKIPGSGANIVFLDIMLPDMSGITVIRRLRADGLTKEKLGIVVVTELANPNIREFFAVGASAYIAKQESIAVFIEALESLLNEPFKTWVQPKVADQLMKIDYTIKKYGLSSAELEILQLIHQSNAEILETLGITINTLRTHLSSIYDKLNITSKQEALEFARFMGLLSSSY